MSQLNDDELLRRSITALGRLVLVCFRQARDMRALLGNLRPWAQTMAEVRKSPNGMRAFALVLRYMFETAKDLEPEEVRTLVETADPETAEEIVSLAEKLLEKGREEGVKQGVKQGVKRGLQRGRRERGCEILLKQLALKFGPLSEADVARVREANEAALDLWAERVLTATTLAETLAYPAP